MSRGTLTYRSPQDGSYVQTEIEGMGEVTVYLSPNDGQLVVEIDTQPGIGEVRVYVNDGQVYAADPEEGP